MENSGHDLTDILDFSFFMYACIGVKLLRIFESFFSLFVYV